MANREKALDALEIAMSEIEDAKRVLEQDEQSDARPAVLDAINQIRSGEFAEAITTLEREFLPKYASSAEAQAALFKHKAAA